MLGSNPNGAGSSGEVGFLFSLCIEYLCFTYKFLLKHINAIHFDNSI